MDTREFLKHVLPTTGPYCIVSGKKKPWWPLPAEDIEEAAEIALKQDRDGYDVWFAVGALRKAQTYDASLNDGAGGVRTSREGVNIRGCRSYTMDIDAGNGRAYESTEAAAAALLGFCRAYKLPRPTVVQSGFGLHVYFTLEEEVAEPEWEAHGKALASMAQAHGLRFDSGRTTDSSSVLRVVGTHNRKPHYDNPEVHVLMVGQPTPTAAFHALLQLQTPEPIKAAAPYVKDEFGTNTNRYEPGGLDPRKLWTNCQLFRRVADPENQARGREVLPEPAWHSAMMLAAHCKDGRTVAHNISRHDTNRYDKGYTNRLFDRLQSYGPVSCAVFENDFVEWGDKYACHGCPSYKKITSPAVVARYVKELPPPIAIERVEGEIREVTAPEMPKDYIRTDTGVGIITANTKTGAPDTIVFCPCDMYPVRIQYDQKTNLSKGRWWNIKLPYREWFEQEIPNCTSNQLRVALADIGVDVHEHHMAFMSNFMTAYVKKLRTERPSEATYSKLGWRDDGSFALGDRLYKPDGSQEFVRMSEDLDNATEHGIRTAGSIDKWKEAISYYSREGCESYRVYFYSTLASALFVMTGEKATAVTATGLAGIGKSTLLDSAASVWGNPDDLVIRGNKQGATINAIEALAEHMNNLPMFLDEVTGREAKDFADFVFTFSGGKGKKRSKTSGGVRGDVARWSSILMANGNVEQYAQISSVYRESDPHTMRLVELDFTPCTTISKAEGSVLRSMVYANYGHAGHMFAQYIAQNQEPIKTRLIAYVAEMDQRIKAASKERFWTAWMACCQLGAEIAVRLGLLPGWPVERDIEWLIAYVGDMRKRASDGSALPNDILSEFLDNEIPRTLALSAASANNISNMTHEPRGGLTVRREGDAVPPTAYVSRSALREYCIEIGANPNHMLTVLQASGIVKNTNMRKVLGAGTPYAMGEVRCIEVDLKKLGKI